MAALTPPTVDTVKSSRLKPETFSLNTIFVTRSTSSLAAFTVVTAVLSSSIVTPLTDGAVRS